MLITEPPPALRISGMAALVPRKTPLPLTSMMRSHSSSVQSSTMPLPTMPALLTRMSSLPNLETAVATASRQSASLVTSSRTKTQSPPASLISASVRRPSSSRISPMTTFAPSRASILASAAPMPLAPPLTSATLPSTRGIVPLQRPVSRDRRLVSRGQYSLCPEAVPVVRNPGRWYPRLWRPATSNGH